MVSVVEKVNSMSSGKKVALLFLVVFALIFVAVLALWGLSVKKAVLFSGLDETDAAAVVSKLDEMKVEYEFDGNGTAILIDEDILHETRLKVMSQGIKLKSGIGFEVFDDAEFGMTEYTQKINFQRALQGELARTIMSINEVKLARVHLVLPKTTLFSKEDEKAKASVTILMQGNASLSAKQIKGIQNLVAASVMDMNSSQVTVLNQKGELLSAATDDDSFLSGARLDQKRAVEAYLTQKAKSILDRAFGEDTAIVRIDVRLNHNRVKLTEENIIPSGEDSSKGVLVMKRNTYSKQPITLSEKSKKVRNNEASSLEAEYKVGRKIEESVIAAGEISRLSIGIMVPASVSEEQIAGVSEMIRMVVGYDKERGDAISVGKLPVFDDAKDNSGNEEQKEVANPKIEKTAPSHVQIAHKPTQTASLNNIDWILKDTRVLLAIIGALLLILLVIILWPRNKNSGDKSSNLTAEEREQVLSEINGWLGVKQSGKGA